MNRDSLTVATPAGTVHATAGLRRGDAVVFELGGAMRGSVHVTGTHHPQHWDRFTAVRACLGPVNAYQTTAPDDALPRLARGSSGYRGSLRLYTDVVGRPQVSVYPMETAAGHEPSPKTAATLTAVLRACAEHLMQREDLPAILTASRERDTPALLRFLDWSVTHHQAEAAHLEAEARAAQPSRRSRGRLVDRCALVHHRPAPGAAGDAGRLPRLAVPPRLRHAVAGPLLPDRRQSRTRPGPPRRDRGRQPAEPADSPAPSRPH
ncbi:hypothetical protein ACGFWG_36705 [Streptomyces sp. NPDC048405]|uniref:hypothetical protein n=1 Tax=Streptomyces sp. NPDC048405 TaxID=3365544 RepID=UPI00371EB4BF